MLNVVFTVWEKANQTEWTLRKQSSIEQLKHAMQGGLKGYAMLKTLVLNSPACDSWKKSSRSTEKLSFVHSRADALFTEENLNLSIIGDKSMQKNLLQWKSLWPCDSHTASVLPLTQQWYLDEHNLSIACVVVLIWCITLPKHPPVSSSSSLVGVGASGVLWKWGIPTFPLSVSSPAVSQDAVSAAAALLLVPLALRRRLAKLPGLLVNAATWGTTWTVNKNRRVLHSLV